MTMKQKRECGSVTALQKFFFSLNENIPTSRIRLPSLRWERRTVANASVAFLEDGEGEGDSAKSEMMVASSAKLRLRAGGVL